MLKLLQLGTELPQVAAYFLLLFLLFLEGGQKVRAASSTVGVRENLLCASKASFSL